jgi:hypothetical protein
VKKTLPSPCLYWLKALAGFALIAWRNITFSVIDAKKTWTEENITTVQPPEVMIFAFAAHLSIACAPGAIDSFPERTRGTCTT